VDDSGLTSAVSGCIIKKLGALFCVFQKQGIAKEPQDIKKPAAGAGVNYGLVIEVELFVATFCGLFFFGTGCRGGFFSIATTTGESHCKCSEGHDQNRLLD
tara:strand:- start:1177 stop:1479 length:303 start_codon:yes stop_codon:yes gene_type:complete